MVLKTFLHTRILDGETGSQTQDSYKGVNTFGKEKKLIMEENHALGTLLVFMAAAATLDAEKLIF
ncbi:MAG: hypothetical protein FWG71_07820 [Synergistaceae bacterium]|nr:hypothetical protein [Synergistaceae bacterium]